MFKLKVAELLKTSLDLAFFLFFFYLWINSWVNGLSYIQNKVTIFLKAQQLFYTILLTILECSHHNHQSCLHIHDVWTLQFSTSSLSSALLWTIKWLQSTKLSTLHNTFLVYTVVDLLIIIGAFYFCPTPNTTGVRTLRTSGIPEDAQMFMLLVLTFFFGQMLYTAIHILMCNCEHV